MIPKRNIYDDGTEAELARWPGITWRHEHRAKHESVVLTFGEATRFVCYPATPGDTRRGVLNHIADLRAELKAMGAEREPQVKAVGPKRRRNVTEPNGLDLGERPKRGPSRDPWAVLVDWELGR